MITKQKLAKLAADRPTRNAEMHYRIDGAVEAAVHTTVEAQRIGELNAGHRTMREADERFQSEMTFQSRTGLPRAQFQLSAKEANKAKELKAGRQASVTAARDEGMEL